MSRNVDLDVLADYTAGLLDGEERANIERLIATDARWASAHTALVQADRMVQADLRRAAAAEPAMPHELAARLDEALFEEALRAGPRSAVDAAPVYSLAAARARRRKFATAVATAAAAAVAVIGGISLTTQVSQQQDSAGSPAMARNTESDISAPEMAGPAAQPPAFALPGGITVVTSGTDYRPETLGRMQRSAAGAGVLATARPSMAAEDGSYLDAMKDAAGGALAQLADPAALDACLQAIRLLHPGTVRLVDFARYAGQPALIVLIEQGGASTVVAAGPACGRSGADIQAVVPAQ